MYIWDRMKEGAEHIFISCTRHWKQGVIYGLIYGVGAGLFSNGTGSGGAREPLQIIGRILGDASDGVDSFVNPKHSKGLKVTEQVIEVAIGTAATAVTLPVTGAFLATSVMAGAALGGLAEGCEHPKGPTPPISRNAEPALLSRKLLLG